MDLNTTTSPPEAAPMDFKTLAGLVHTLQTATIAALIFAVCAYIPKLKQRSQLSKLPTISGAGYLTNAKEKYKEGYQKVSFFFDLSSRPDTNVGAVQRRCLSHRYLRW
jgi:hypothetical protein